MHFIERDEIAEWCSEREIEPLALGHGASVLLCKQNYRKLKQLLQEPLD